MNAPQRVLIVSHDAHLALALQTSLAELGKTVRCERNGQSAKRVIEEFDPDAMLTVSVSSVFLKKRHSSEIVELPRPIRIPSLVHLLECDGDNLGPCDAEMKEGLIS